MNRVVVDPVTRIEGHLRIEAETASDGTITSAYSSGTMVRGIELILNGRDPRDAWAFAQRICGVCTLVHGIASVRAVENALDYTIPPNAQLIRNLMIAAQYVHDHVMHFYHLHALDWVDVVSALKADPAATSQLAQSISSWPNSSPGYFTEVRKKVQAFVESGQLGIFANGFWGHPGFRLPPEVNLLALAHYLEALSWQREVVQIHTIFGGKNPHPNFLVGGAPSPISIDAGSSAATAFNLEGLDTVRQVIGRMKDFVEQVYLPDTLAIASFYKDWFARGEGIGNFLTYGDFPEKGSDDPSSWLIPSGVILDRDLSAIHPVDLNDPAQIQEFVSHSWYDYGAGKAAGLHPYSGETNLDYTGPKPPYEQLDVEKSYSWLKSPRWKGKAMEVGPLARVLMLHAKGHEPTRELARFCARQAGPPARRDVLDHGAHGGAHPRKQDRGRPDAGLARQPRRQHQERRPCRAQPGQVGSVLLAEACPRRRLHGSAAGRARALDRHQGQEDRQLPGRRPLDMERRSARRQGAARPLRGRAHGPAFSPRSQAAAGNPAHHPQLRSLHRLRRPCRRPAWRGTDADQGSLERLSS